MIRISASGYYTVANALANNTWAILLGTTPVLNTGAVAANINQTSAQTWSETAYITIVTTGVTGTAIGSLQVIQSSGSVSGSPMVVYSTAPSAAVSFYMNNNTGVQIQPTFQYSVTGNNMVENSFLIELLN